MAEEERFSFRWGIPWLDSGHTSIPNFMLRHYIEVGVTRAEFLAILHLASYHYESAQGQASPSLATVANEMGMTRRGLRKLLRSLEEKGMLTRHYRTGDTSIYILEGFSRKALEAHLAQESTSEEGGRNYSSEGVGTTVPRGAELQFPQRTKEKQHQEESDDGGSSGLAQKLIALKVHEGQARKWATLRPPAMVLGWIEYIRRNGHSIHDVPAFLVSKLRGGEEPPAMHKPEDDRRRYIEGPYAHLIQH